VQGPLSTEHLKSDLAGRSVRGGILRSGVEAFGFAVRFGSMLVLARLLGPADFGLIAMVTAVVWVLDPLQNLGLPMATVQRAGLSREQISTLFWIQVGLGVLGMLLTAALGPGMAWFYREPRLIGIALALSILRLSEGLMFQHHALLQRQMRFAALSVVDASAMLLSAAVAIVAAALGAGYWALVLRMLTSGLAVMVGVWIACGWLPGAPSRRSGVRSMISFGARLTASGLILRASRNLAEVLVGRFAGGAALGLFTRARSFLALPGRLSTPLASVALPALSRLQDQPERYRGYYQKAVLPLVVVGMPLVTFVFVDADQLVLTLLGGQWTEVVPILRLLAPAGFVHTFSVATNWVFVSCGRADRQLRWSLVTLVLRIAALVVGVQWGLAGVAAAHSLVAVALVYPGAIYCFYTSPLQLSDLLGVLWRPTLASLAAGVALFSIEGMVAIPAAPVLALAVGGALYAALYLLAWLALPGGAAILRELAELVRHLRLGRPGPVPL
jgi:O-antigen/teichoic acid export membrane protein